MLLSYLKSRTLSDQVRLQLWCPDLSASKGGIQVFSAFLLQALQSIYPDIEYDVIVKHDANHTTDTLYRPQTCFYFAGAWPTPIRTSAFAAQLIRLGLVHHPNLVISTHLNFSVAAYWLKRLAGIPYWVIAHGIEAWDIKRPHLQVALRHADRILAVSSYTRDRLLKEQKLDPSKVSILPNTVGPHDFKISPKPAYLLERYGLAPDQPVILTVSRLVTSEQYKGYDKILRALPQIRQAIPNVHYIIAGQGDDRPRIEKSIRQYQLQECVTLAGFVPGDELCDHYNLCDVFAMPSKREGFGIVYLEALACGKPTLAGNKDGAIDALRNGELGALVDPDNIDEIAQTLIRILRGIYPHPIMYQPEMLRERVIDAFGFERFKQTLSKQLDGVLIRQA